LLTDLLLNIKSSLILAAKGDLILDVQAEYTNISIMSPFLMNYVGTEFGIAQLKIVGLNKAHEIYNLFHQYNTSSEYTIPRSMMVFHSFPCSYGENLLTIDNSL